MRIKINVPFSQMDSRWAALLLGFNTVAKYNFYNYACLITCLAMIARYYGKDDTPITINDKLKELGSGNGFVAGGGDYVYGAIHKIYSGIDEILVRTPSALTDDQVNEIKVALDAGYPVVFQIDYDPKDVDLDSHFVLVVDYNSGDENDFTIVDPLGGNEKSLKSYLGWYKPSMRKTVEKYLIFKSKVPTSSQTVAVPADQYPDIIHGSTEWDKTSAEYLPTADPKQSMFSDVQRVVNGYKSDATTAKNNLASTQIELKSALTEVENQKDKLANIDKDRQREIELLNAQIIALKEAQPNIDKLVAQYQGTIDAINIDLRDAQKTVGLRNTKITELETQIAQLQSGAKTLSILEQAIAWIKSVWKS